MILGRRGEVELEEDARDVLLDRAWRDEEPVGDRLVRAALGHELEHLALARRQERERVVPAASAEELGDDGGVERGAPLRDAPHGRRELVDVRHPILQQVSETLGRLREEVHRVGGLHVLREDEHARFRSGVAESPPRRGAPRRCASEACGCRRSRHSGSAWQRGAGGRRRFPTARRRRSPRRRAAGRFPLEAAPCRPRARP